MTPDKNAKMGSPVALLRLHEADTVACLPASVPAGGIIVFGGDSWQLDSELGLGHKISLVPIRAGEKIIKFGVSIGSASRDIQPGEHVHLDNLRSDYLPTYTLSEGSQYAG